MHANKERLKGYTNNFLRLDRDRKSEWARKSESSSFYSLCLKSHQAYEAASNGSESPGERDGRVMMLESGGLEKPVAIVYGCNQTVGRTPGRPEKFRKVENVPKYTTWIYLDRLYDNPNDLLLAWFPRSKIVRMLNGARIVCSCFYLFL